MPDSSHVRRSTRTRRASSARSVSSPNGLELAGAVLPPGDLGRYLRAISLSGAPALNFPLWGMRRGADLFPLPITNPSALRPGWLAGELARIPFGGVPLRRKDVEQLVEMLAPGPSRTDGLPYYRPDLWGWDQHRSKKGRRRGIPRRLAVAVASDLGDHSLVEIGAKVLRRRDEEPSRQRSLADPKADRELRRRARRYLAELGAWPWTHAPRGKLPGHWRTEDAFLEPLQAWFERARREVDQGLTDSMRALSDARSFRRSDLLKLPLEDAVPRVEPDVLHQRILQKLERRVASAETIADADGAQEIRAEVPRSRPEHG